LFQRGCGRDIMIQGNAGCTEERSPYVKVLHSYWEHQDV
jgi:hypothetical protein